MFKQNYFLFLVALLIIYGCAVNKNIVDSTSLTTLETHTYFTLPNKEKLALDFYKSNQFTNDLPLLIYVHGGGFSSGARDEDFIKEFCTKFAKKGFAVASISYRLSMKKYGFGCNTPANLKIDAFTKASEDISLATEYLLENSNKFGIDTKKFILIGSSAGAEAILNLAFMYQNQILPKDFKYAGLISMAGAVTSVDNITKENAIPTLFFHGKKDKLVPFNEAPHHYCKKNSKGYLPLFGSKAIANQLKKVDGSYSLVTIEDGNHSWNWKPMKLSFNRMISFIDNQIIQEITKQEEVIKKESNYNSSEL